MADGPKSPAQDPDTLFQAALDLHRAGRLEEAVAAYRQVAATQPERVAAHINMGVALRRLGRLDEALASYDRALAAQPDEVDALNNRGNLLRDLGRPAQALESYDRAIALGAETQDLLANRGHALRDLKRPAEALASYDRALAHGADNPRILADRAGALFDLERWGEAVASYDRALALDPNQAQALNGRGSALFALDQAEAAIESYDRAIALAPGLELAHRNRGLALQRLGRLDEAVASHDRAIALQPTSVDAHWNRGLCHLTAGRFAEGWQDYERRWELESFLKLSSGVPDVLRAQFTRPQAPQDLAGRRVLLAGEQGIGDAVMFASILPDLMADAASVSLVCEPRLRRLFSHSFPGLALLDAETATARLADFEVVLPIGGLARLYRNRLEDFPGRPYLAARPEAVAAWAERLGPAEGRRRVGLSWRGGMAQTRRAARSIDLADLRPLLDLPDCEFVSLQYGTPEAEVAAVNASLSRPIRLFAKAEIDDFEDLAGLVQNLDLVVSVQTALVHLSGALGAKALVMVPAVPEWRYTAAAPTMPWYGSVTLLRQGPDKAWAPVIRRVVEAVGA